MQLSLLAVAVLALTPVLASAQTPSSEFKSSVSGIAGAGRTWDDEGSLGTGLAIGARVDRVIFGTTRAEAAVDVLTHDRGSGYFLANGRTTLATVSLVHRFGSGRAQPYILGGALLAHHSGWFELASLGRRDVSSTDVGAALGAGLVVLAGERLEIGPELRILGIQPDVDSSPATAYWVGIRAGYRF